MDFTEYERVRPGIDVRGALRDFRRTWPQLLLTDLLARIAAFVVLTPVTALLLGLFLIRTDDQVLTDTDIAVFVLHPIGITALIVVGGVGLAVLFAKQAVLMVVGFGFALEQPKYFDFAFLTPSRAIGPVADEISRPDWQTFRMAIDQVGACMEQGIFVSDDPLEAGITLWAGAHGLITLFRTGRFGQDVELFRGIYHASIERLLKGMMVPGEAASQGTESHG